MLLFCHSDGKSSSYLVKAEGLWPCSSLSGSWVELEELMAAVSRRESLAGPEDSISASLQGELERILLEAQLECERTRER